MSTRIIRIEESKYDKMSEYAEKMLKYGGKLMHCIEEMREGRGYDDFGMREYDRTEERDYDDDNMTRGFYDEDDDDEINYRRMRKYSGRRMPKRRRY